MEYHQTLPVDCELIGEFRVLELLGSGGFANTYLALEQALGRRVAIKEFFPSDLAVRRGRFEVQVKAPAQAKLFGWGRERFVHEAKTLAKFRHPNIVRVFRVFEANDTAYIVLEFVKGADLEHWLAALGRPPTQAELDELVAPLLDALEVVHNAGILHRDVKPANIYIREADQRPVLIDFGAARYAMGEHAGTTAAIVSRGYSPHEAYATDIRLQGPWTDIYGLAATIYRALSGSPPPEATSRVLSDDFVPTVALPAVCKNYRPEFLAAIDAGMALMPKARPQSIGDWRRLMFPGLAAAMSAENRPVSQPGMAPKGPTSAPPAVSAPPATSGPISDKAVARASLPQRTSKPGIGPSAALSGARSPAVPSAIGATSGAKSTLALGLLLLFFGAAALVVVRMGSSDPVGGSMSSIESTKGDAAAEQRKAEREAAEAARQKEAAEAARQKVADEKRRAEAEAEAARVRREQEAAEAARPREADEKRRAEAEAKAAQVRRDQAAAEAARQKEAEDKRRAEAEAERIRREQAAAEAARQEEAEEKRRAEAEAERIRREQVAAEAARQEEADEKRRAEAERVRREQQDEQQREQLTQQAAIEARPEIPMEVLPPTSPAEIPAAVKSQVPTEVERANYLKQVQTALKAYNCYTGEINGDPDDAGGALKRFETNYEGSDVRQINLTTATVADYEDWLSWSNRLEKFSCPSEPSKKTRTERERTDRKKVQKPKEEPRETKKQTRPAKKEARSTPPGGGSTMNPGDMLRGNR